jgi:hypothetical protein
MRKHWLSIVGCALAAAVLSSAGHAAEYRRVNKPSDPRLTASMKLWTGLTKGICGTGCQSIVIINKRPSEGWASTVQQVLWKPHTQGVDALKIKATKSSIATAVDVLFQKNDTLNAAAGRVQMINSIYNATRGKGRAIYAGDIWGANRNYAHITVRDKTTNQLLSIFAGTP